MKKILVVDDEQIMLTLSKKILGPYYDVVTVTSGKDALEVYEKEKPDLVLLDVYMPEMSGYETLYILRERFGKNVKAMFVTADDRVEGESEGFENGAIDYVRKPFRSDVLLRRVEIVLQNQEELQDLKTSSGTDPMTGFLNSGTAKDEIDDACCHGERGMLLVLNLDNMKQINDKFGHNMGDQILLRFSFLLRQITRSSDVVGRIGGDEFAVFFRTVPTAELIGKRCKFLNEGLVTAMVEMLGDDCDIPLGVSIGGAAAPDEGQDYNTLMTKAKSALRMVKRHGKHNFGFYGASENRIEDMEDAEEDSLQHVVYLFGERNRMPGAYVVNREMFKPIFQVLRRVSDQYGRNAQLLMLTLEKEEVSEELAERFCTFLVGHLRRSDLVMRYQEKSFLVMLPDTAMAGGKFMLRRIENSWGAMQENEGATFRVESMDIRAGF